MSDSPTQILLNRKRNIETVDEDVFKKIQLQNNKSLITEHSIRNIANASEIFQQERESTDIYKIYGRITSASLLNNLEKSNPKIEQLFIKDITNKDETKNIRKDFKFYLLIPDDESFVGGTDDIYTGKFKVIATPDKCNLIRTSMGNDVFHNKTYYFDFSIDVDIKHYLDGLGYPITNLFLFCEYQKNQHEGFKYRTRFFGGNGLGMADVFNPYNYQEYEVGDIFESPYQIRNYPKQYKYEYLLPQFRIETDNIENNGGHKTLRWLYDAILPIRIKYFSDTVSKINTNTPRYDEAEEIPFYAHKPIEDEDNFIWRELLPHGLIDPITDKGVDFPFLNKKHYVFSNNMINIIPDLNHTETKNVFNDIAFYGGMGEPSEEEYTPISETPENSENIGDPC